MEAKDLTTPLPSCNSSCKSEDGELHISNCDPKDADSEPSKLEVKGDKPNREIPGTSEADVGNDKGQFLQAAELVCVLNGGSSALQDSVELNETVAVAEDTGILSSRIQSEKGCLNVQDGSPISSQKRNGSPVSNSLSGVKAGVKRAKMKVDDQQPSVLVTYNFLTRDSKRKLEELLQHWSEWHAQHCSLPHDTSEVLESGENKYFPALRFGLGNSSSVSFWMDNQSRNWHEKELIPMEGNSVPLYDRGYSLALTSTDGSSNLEGGLEIIDGSRCFNCGSYNHSLKDCMKPRDNAAVNSARKQHKSRRNQNASSRNSTRYYQDSPQGKYDGLRPGVLDAETRNLLGLGELDPPPWLNRMREIGYPPGYLDTEDEEQPSGITIFADEEMKEEKEDGEILEAAHPESPRKMRVPRNMSVEFPGLNAPIPENADERRWAAGRSSLDSSRNRSHRRKGMGDNRLPLEPPTYSSEPITRGGQYHEQRWSRDFRDDGPPGCDPGFSPTYSSFTPRYGDYDSGHHSQSARGNISTPQSPRFGRSLSDRGRWNPLVYEDSPNSGSYSSAPYSPPSRLYPPRYDSLSSEKRDDSRWRENDPNFSSHAKDNKHDRHHHHSRR